MNEQRRGNAADAEAAAAPLPSINVVETIAPLRWLGRGFNDLLRAPLASLFYGVVLAAMGSLLVSHFGGAVGLALSTGFLLLGPFLAVGIYDLSRQLEQHGSCRLAPSLAAWRSNLPAIGFYALILMLSLAVWTRISVVIVALLVPAGADTLWKLLHVAAQSPASAAMALGYLAIGALLAAFSFSISAVALPLLLDQPRMDAISAMIVSFQCMSRNPSAMALWAVLIVVLTLAGFLSWFAGLAVTIPLIGHATWHAYRETLTSASE